jgi:arylsulfatase A-like enzyme
MDWTATLLALAGAQPSAAAPLDGIDLMPALTGAATVDADRDLYWRISQRRRQKALRSGSWKYLRTEDGEFLFDLAADAGETRDIKADRPDILAQLTAKYAAWERQVLQPLALDPARA